MAGKRVPIALRFESKVDRRPTPRGCHLWTAAVNANGYGKIGAGGKRSGHLLAHRVAWELERGPVPEGLGVLHECDVPRCVNVDHLFLGTQLDNIRDMHRKGRYVRPSKLNLQAISVLRHFRRKVVARVLSGLYGVHPVHVRAIQCGRFW